LNELLERLRKHKEEAAVKQQQEKLQEFIQRKQREQQQLQEQPNKEAKTQPQLGSRPRCP
jgi:hypothetical protein